MIEYKRLQNRFWRWAASEHTHDVDGFDGKVTRAAAERELAKRHDGSDNMFYNIIRSNKNH